MIYSETPRRKLVTRLVSWGHWFTFTNILIGIVIASVYLFNSPAPDSALGTLYLFCNWFSHIGFLTFMGFVILVLPLCYLIPNAKLVKSIGATVASIGLAMLAFDGLLYNKYGLHLNLGSAELIKNETATYIANFSWPQWGVLLLIFIAWLCLQLIIANALWQRIERFQKRRIGLLVSSVFVLCFTTSHALHIWADANLYQPIVQQDDMFPLSYPATAKTLMAKYGLLDIENYQQRKQLQFNRSIGALRYPAAPMYCAVSGQTSQLLLLHINDGGNEPNWEELGLIAKEQHYDISSSAGNALISALYGLPEIYHQALKNSSPVLLDLPSKLQMPVYLYAKSAIHMPKIGQYQLKWEDFLQDAQQPGPKLAVALVDSEQLDTLLSPALVATNEVMVIELKSQNNPIGGSKIYTNMHLSQGLSSNEDLAPTLLHAMGCGINSDSYSTGQNLIQPRRNWLVSTQGSKVLVLRDNERVEVLKNGHYKLYHLGTEEEISGNLNTGLLSQAIKHLSRFSGNE